jgi:cholesterol oxidase
MVTPRLAGADEPFDADVVVIGSGFGGSVAALRLVEKDYRVVVMEAGRRFSADDLPRTNWDLRRFLWQPRLGLRGIQRLTLLKDVLVLSGAGVGGGSLVYANTLYRPLPAFYADPQWRDVADWATELEAAYDQASRMLGVTDYDRDTPSDVVLRRVADRMGVPGTFHRTPVGVYLGEPGRTVDDPYFGGAGPERTGCIHCGACMVGCRFGAKNTLDRNYLYLAEAAGVEIRPDTEVVDLEAFPGGGWRITSREPGWRGRGASTVTTAGQVVLAAGVLGTLRLLLAARDRGRLPGISGRLGAVVRTNSEAIVGATRAGAGADYSQGVAITSSIHTDEHTHIEPVRYPKGSNAMALLATMLVDGGGRVPRQVRFLGQVARHPVAFLRSLSVRRWSERTVILLVMQSLDNSMRVVRKGRRLTTAAGPGEANPTYLPAANRAARLAAAEVGGAPTGSIFEALLDVPTTAHIIGGCVIGPDPTRGVVDPWQRVYGCPGLHVADGSVVPANLGVNPSLTITALAERAFSFWPNRSQADPRPALGSAYRPVAAVAPGHPCVPAGAPGALTMAGPRPAPDPGEQ